MNVVHKAEGIDKTISKKVPSQITGKQNTYKLGSEVAGAATATFQFVRKRKRVKKEITRTTSE